MSETWYCFQHLETYAEVRITVIDEPTEEQMHQAGELMKDGYKLKIKQELGQTKKCKDNIV